MFCCIAATNYAYAAKLSQYLTDNISPRVILVSGVQSIGQPSCVNFTFVYNLAASFIVRAPACLLTDHYGILLETSVPSQGADWSSIYLPIIPVTSSPCDAQLQFEVTLNQNFPDRSFTIGDVTVSHGSCLGMCVT